MWWFGRHGCFPLGSIWFGVRPGLFRPGVIRPDVLFALVVSPLVRPGLLFAMALFRHGVVRPGALFAVVVSLLLRPGVLFAMGVLRPVLFTLVLCSPWMVPHWFALVCYSP